MEAEETLLLWEALSGSPRETERMGERLGARLGAASVVALIGDLGTGKTTFTRGLARGLGVSEAVTSPSFTLMQEHEGRLPLYHFDAWMTGREELFLQGGGAEYLGGAGVCVVEWADRIEGFLPRPRLELRLRHVPGRAGAGAGSSRELRMLLVRAGGGAGARRLEQGLDRAARGAAAGSGEG